MKAKFVLSKGVVHERYNSLKSIGLRVSYSFKTNPEVARVLEFETDSEFSIHSIKQVSGVSDKSRVWFLPQGWSEGDIKWLLDVGVNKFIIDNEVDLRMLDKLVIDKEISLLIRIKMKEHTVHTGKYFVYGFSTARANELIKEFSAKPYVKVIGIHFHRKTENVSEWSIIDELSESISVWDKIGIVNIGGGLPIKYANVKNFNINHIFDKIVELRDWLERRGVQLMIEPGRFICGPAVKLVAEIVNVVDRTIFINCSVYNSFPDTLFYSLKLMVDGEVSDGVNYLIKGNTPCSMDIFRYSVKLPFKPVVGGEITFLNAGAYNFYTSFMWLDPLETEVVD